MPPPSSGAKSQRATDEDDLVQQHLAPGPAAADSARTGRPNEVHARPAPLWRRLLAFIIDAAIVIGVAAVFLFIATSVAGVTVTDTPYRGFDRLIHFGRAFESVLKPTLALAVVLALLYSTLFAIIWGGRTVGRRVVGIQLVDGSGLPPTPLRAAVRSLLALLSFALFLGGFWLALFDRRGQTLHDKLTFTFVIRRK